MVTFASHSRADDAFAAAFPERAPAAGYRPETDFFTASSVWLVQERHRARVEYPSGRVVTLHAVQGRGVNKDGTVVLKRYGDGHTLRVALAGLQAQPPDGYTHEQTYGWQGGPLVDETARDRPVLLKTIENHSLLQQLVLRDFWLEMDQGKAWLYGNRPVAINGVSLYCLNCGQIKAGMAHAARDPKTRNREILQTFEDEAARKRKGLWDEKRWRAEQKKGFAFLTKRTGTPAPAPAPAARQRRTSPRGR